MGGSEPTGGGLVRDLKKLSLWEYVPPVLITTIAIMMTTKKVILSAPNMTSRNPYT